MTTDPISSLADQILALINASPRTPTKDQIEETLRALTQDTLRTMVDAELLASYPGFIKPKASRAPGLTDADWLDACRQDVARVRFLVETVERERLLEEQSYPRYVERIMEKVRATPDLFDLDKVAEAFEKFQPQSAAEIAELMDIVKSANGSR